MNAVYSFFSKLVILVALGCSFVSYAQQTKEQMASYYFQNKEYDKAVELYEPLYQSTQNKYYYQMLNESYQMLERYKDAERLIEKRIKQYPKDLYLLVDLGQVQAQKGDVKRSEKTFESAIEKIGYDNQQISDLTMAFLNAGRPDLAIKTYLFSRQKMKNPFAYVMELATLYERMGNYEGMMSEYFDLLDNSPNQIGNIQISLQRALNETSNPQLSNGLRSALVQRVQEQPNNRNYLDMMIWFSLQQKDFQFALTQAKAIESRFPGKGEEQVLRVAQIALNNDDAKAAIDGFSFLVKKGSDSPFYFDSRVGVLNAKFSQINKNYSLSSSDYSALKREYSDALLELGKNTNTIPLIRNFAYLQAYYGNEIQEAVDLLYDVIEMPQVPKSILDETKLELGDLLLFGGSIWDASLLYSQVEKQNKNDLIGAQAKFKNAKLSYYNNDFEWAKTQLDVLRSATSKLIANDAMELSLFISDNMEDDSTYSMLEMYAAADLLLFRNQLEEAWAAFDAIGIHALSHPILDDVLFQKAKIRMKQGRYAESDSLLQKLVDFYAEDILADDALMLMAEINESQLANLEKAKSCYEKILLDYPGSLYVDRARKRYNEIRVSLN